MRQAAKEEQSVKSEADAAAAEAEASKTAAETFASSAAKAVQDAKQEVQDTESQLAEAKQQARADANSKGAQKQKDAQDVHASKKAATEAEKDASKKVAATNVNFQ